MSGFKMDCPSCGLILTTPDPVPAGTLVNCPKCGTCFGVPALEIKTAASVVPMAQAVADPTPPPVAPAVVPATPPVAARATPTVARARPKAARAAGKEDSWFPELETASARVRSTITSRKPAEPKSTEPHAKRTRKRHDHAALIWSLVVAGAVAVLGGVALWKFAGSRSDAKAKAPPAAAREGRRNASAPAKADATSPPERKAAAAAPAPEKRNKAATEKKNATANKDKTTEKKKDGLTYEDSNEKPIPGVQTTQPGKKMK